MIERVKSWFDLENPLFAFAKKFGWVVLVNFVYLITCIPVITIGASTTAMYTVLYKLIEEREFHLLKDYFRSFKQHFFIATLFWVPMLFILLVMFINVTYVFEGMAGTFAILMRVATIVIAVIFCMLANAVFPLIAKFDLTYKEIIPILIEVVFKHIFLSLEGVIFTIVLIGGSVYMLFNWGGIFGLLVYIPILACGLHAFMLSYLYDKMFEEYVEPEEHESIFDEDYEDWNDLQ